MRSLSTRSGSAHSTQLSRRTLRLEPLEPRLLLSAADPTLQVFNVSPALFAENLGQWQDPSIRYVFQSSGGAVAHTDAGPVFYLSQHEQTEDGEEIARSTSFSVTFEGAETVSPVGQDRSDAVYNYFIGDPSRWRAEVPTFQIVAYPGLWSGIDLLTWGRRGGLKHEFHVAPGADPGQIRLHYEGTEGLSLDESGALHIATALGEVVDDAPILYQEIGGQRVEVAGAFQLLDASTCSFILTSPYDPQAELVIDPAIAWSSYLGGSDDDYGEGIAVDGSGNAFITGGTLSPDLPTPGGFDTALGYGDAYITKVSGSGALLWSSYLGGSDCDWANGIAVDGSGNAFITGETRSSDFPTPGGFDTTYNGGYCDAFVTKVSGAGALLWSSFLGGSHDEDGWSIAVDGSGNAFITGGTSSSDFPTPGGFDTTLGDPLDAFVTKVSGSGVLLWSSYLGGSDSHGEGESGDLGYAIAVDGSGNAFITGLTCSWDFPTPGGFDRTYGHGDAFVAKVSGSGALLWSSYLGGSDGELRCGIAVDGSGNAFITGYTESSDFPTPGGFDTTYDGYDTFVTKVSGSGALLWSSYLGGSGEEWPGGIAVDGSGNAFITGTATSSDFPAPGGFDTDLNGACDAFVAKITDVPLTVVVEDGHGNRLPYVRVQLWRDNLSYSETVYTNAEGSCEFAGYPKASDYRIKVELDYRPDGESEDWFKVMHASAGVYVQTSKFALDPTQSEVKTINFGAVANLTTAASIPTDRLDDLAASYHYLSEYWDFVAEELGVTPDLDLPLEIHGYGSGTGAYYLPSTNEIYISAPESAFGGSNQPMNREWHESGHYLQDDSIGLGVRHGGDSNHNGFANHCTGDSWSEGWAEFWPIALKFWRGDANWFNYAGFGSLETNYRVWELEEFAVAGVLLDLIDGVGENGLDPAQISIGDLWNVIGTDLGLDDFKDVYDALVGASIGQGDADSDGTNDLDEIFVAHGFFADANTPGQAGYRVWNAGEEIGRAADAGRPERRNTPYLESAELLAMVINPEVLPSDGAQVEIRMEYPSPWEEYDYVDVRPFSDVTGGLVYIHPGPEWLNPTVTVTVADSEGGSSDSIQFTMDEYRAMVERTERSYTLVHAFEMGAAGTTAASDVFADSVLDNPEWFSCYIELAPGESADEIDLTGVRITHLKGLLLSTPIAAASDPGLPFVGTRQTADNDGDGVPELLVRFPMEAVLNALGSPSGGPQTVTVAWTDSFATEHEGTGGTAWPADQVVLDAQHRTWSFVDEDGTAVTVTWRGAGTANVERPYDPRTGQGDMHRIAVDDGSPRDSLTITTKATVRGQVAETTLGGLIVHGSLGKLTAKTTDLVGDLTVEGSLGRLWLDDVRDGLTITIGTWDNPRAATTLVFDQVSDLVILSAMPIKSLTATEWLDTDATPDQIFAPWIGKLTTKGARGNTKRGIDPIPGDFEASLDLDGTGDPRLTLGSAKVKGDLTNATWDITGNVGSITAGDADGWTLNVQSTLKSLKLNEVNATTIAVDGPVGSVTVAEWDTGSLEAGSLGSLKVTGNKKALVAGDFDADVTLTAPLPRKPALSSAKIAGSVGDGVWNVTGDIGSVSVTGNFGGELHAQSIKSMTVKDNMDGSMLDLTRGLDPLNPKLMALAKLSVTGWIQECVITTPGHIGSVTAGGMRDSTLFAGVATARDDLGMGAAPDGVFDLPDLAGLTPPAGGRVAGIKSVTIKGIKVGKVYQDSFINTNIAAGSLGKVTLCYAELDNDGNASATDVPFGLVSGTPLGFAVSYKDVDPTHKFAWKAGQLLPAWLPDTDLMVVCG